LLLTSRSKTVSVFNANRAMPHLKFFFAMFEACTDFRMEICTPAVRLMSQLRGESQPKTTFFG
jgi:hypothetical protein